MYLLTLTYNSTRQRIAKIRAMRCFDLTNGVIGRIVRTDFEAHHIGETMKRTLFATITLALLASHSALAVPNFDFNKIVCTVPSEDKGTFTLDKIQLDAVNEQLTATATITQSGGITLSGRAFILFTTAGDLLVTAFDSMHCALGPYNEAGNSTKKDTCWTKGSNPPNASTMLCTASK